MILVTGGLGYIGSVLVDELRKLNIDVCIVDNQSRSKRTPPEGIPYEIVDVRETEKLKVFMRKQKVTAVVHLAGFMINDESILKPDIYYSNNTDGTLSVLKAMVANSVKTIVFASTSSIYESIIQLLSEESKIAPDTPYARSKWYAEEMIRFYVKNNGINAGIPRFFNVSGANENYGERHWPETCLVPLLIDACIDKRDGEFSIYGNEHHTADGYCVRDFIHILDLIEAILKILDYVQREKGQHVFNLGSGSGYSVKEVVDLAQAITNTNLAYNILEARQGDPASLVADITKARRVINYKPKHDLKDIILSQYHWMAHDKLLIP